ncbi:hypothetical protein BG003_005907 [Podila horticola]|nr:hypothetical protein BG003_005907 [Podila horticola]
MSSGRSNPESISTGTNGINNFTTPSTTHSINGTKTKGLSNRFRDEPGGYDSVINNRLNPYLIGVFSTAR